MFANRLGVATLLSVCCMAGGQSPVTGISPTPAKLSPVTMQANYGNLPLAFEANQGQADAQVRFTSRGNGYSLFLSDKEAVLALNKGGAKGSHSRIGASAVQPSALTQPKRDVVRMQLVGAADSLKVAGTDKLEGTANYFIGSDPAKWHRDVPTYGKVRYEGVYPGIDLVYYGKQQQLEYDFIVAPHADPKPIRLHFAGAKELKLDSNGDLKVMATNGQVAFHKPVVYQEIDGKRKNVEGSFALLAKNDVGFRIKAYDHSRSLIVDPTLAYSTYLGGPNSYNLATALAVDGAGDVYVTGEASGTGFPVTAGAYQPVNESAAESDLYVAFVAKLNATGTALLYATYLGGSGNLANAGDLYHGDYPESIAVDAAGNAFITGTAYSADFPVTSGAFQRINKAAANGVPNGFVTKLNASGTGLIYSTYLGGTGLNGFAGSGGFGSASTTYGDGCSHVAINADGEAYVTGVAYSTDFPTTSGAFQTSNHSAAAVLPNAFVTKLSADGSSLRYSTYLGGSLGDGASGLALDAEGNTYITGAAYSADFPVTSGALQSTNKAFNNGVSTAFVTKVNASGSNLVYSTYLGGSGFAPGDGDNDTGDIGASVALDANENLYVLGLTSSPDFPVTSGAFQTTNTAAQNSQGTAFFISKLNPAGTSLAYSTYLGSSQFNTLDDSGGLAVDTVGHAFITGQAYGSDFPVTSNAFQTQPACVLETSGVETTYSNPVVTELSADGSSLVYSTYFGSSGYVIYSSGSVIAASCDMSYALALDPSGNVYVTGATASPSFPVTSGAYQTTNSSLNAAFIAKLSTQSSGSGDVTVATPVFSIAAGVYTSVQSVSISDATAGAAIYYTTDGSAPTTASTLYAGPISVSLSETIRAYAVATGYAPSVIISSTYTIISGVTATPVISPASGIYASAQTVTITDSTPGSTISYAVFGSGSSAITVYTGPFTVSSTAIVEAFAIASGYSESGVAVAIYTITPAAGLQFVPVPPCRVADTRGAAGSFGSPELGAGVSREFDLPQSGCGIPASAVAYSLNVTVLPNTVLQYLTMWPSGTTQPNVSTLNSYDGRVKANAAIVPAGTNGGVNVFTSDASNVILDVNGYFVPAGTDSSLAFYPLTPCRVADTRGGAGPLGGPFLTGNGSRSFPVQSSNCGIPSSAQAYSLNLTTIPHSTLNYLTTWPTGQAQPNVSTLNAPTGAVTANAAIVPAGSNGGISLFVSDDADVILDINGYFAPADTGGLSLYTTTPCRVLDTRGVLGAFTGVLQTGVETSPCALPAAAQAYVLNATVVPPGPLNYLTLWPDSETQPNVSTLNANDAAITSNMAIVPTVNGSIDAFSSDPTQLILDISSYFAP